MKPVWLSAAAAAALLASASLAMAADAPTPADQQTPHYGTWGYDLSARDPAVKPGDDFYRFAEGRATDQMQIPSDRSRYGSFDKLAELSDARVHAVLEKAAADGSATGDERKVGDFYKSFMDEGRVESLDARPMQAELQAIRAAGDRDALARLMGTAPKSFYSSLFGVGPDADQKAPTRYTVYLGQGGLGLPDRDYYLNPSLAAKKAAYQDYVATMLGLAGWADPQASAKAVVDFETKVAQGSWSLAERRDPTKTYNPTTIAELQKTAPGFDWADFFTAADLGQVPRVVVNEKTAIPALAAIWAETPVDTLKAWTAFHLADNAAPYLSKRFTDASFAFHGKALSGQSEQRTRWKRAATAVDGQIGEAVGKVYVADYFPAQSKAKAEQLIAELRAALAARIQKLDWMSPETKAKALDKLSKFTVKVGYPDKFRDYAALKVSADDLYGNVERGAAFEWAREVNRLNDPVDKSEWGMTPQTVNAYYNPVNNEIVFPAAIMQPPFFDPKADMAVNYGGIGAVIGHEMTHGFDDEGRHYAGDGSLSDWWTTADAAKFDAKAKVYGAEFGAVTFSNLPGAHIVPEQTMGENIADLGGLNMALDAYHASLHGRPAPVIDGLTGDQRVFLGWAQVWRSKYKDDALQRQITANVHSPDFVRAETAPRNIDAWYKAFNIKPGDKLYIPPDQRVKIW